jgi:hypothetical protein
LFPDILRRGPRLQHQKAGRFEPDKFEDQYETALVDLINQKRAGKPITAKERPRGENVVDLMEALRRSVGGAAAETKAPKKPKKPRQGRGRPEGNAHAYCRQETGEGGRREEAGVQTAAEVGLGRVLLLAGKAQLWRDIFSPDFYCGRSLPPLDVDLLKGYVCLCDASWHVPIPADGAGMAHASAALRAMAMAGPTASRPSLM